MEVEVRRVLEATFPGEEARYFLPMSIGSTPETADEGATLILNGTKTLTSSPFWDYPDSKIPFVGALSVLLDGSRRPRGIVETTRVEIMSLGAITEEMARAYGEGERTVEWWLQVMGGHCQLKATRRISAQYPSSSAVFESRQGTLELCFHKGSCQKLFRYRLT
jgi:uncharacterized protein YhfF